MTNALYALAPGTLRIMRGGACLAAIERADLSPDETIDFAEKITAALNAFNPLHQAFRDLPWSVRRAQVQAALDTALRALLASVGTPEIAAAVTQLLIPGKAEARDTKLIFADLMKLADETPEATRSSATFERFGKTMRRWVWSPRT